MLRENAKNRKHENQVYEFPLDKNTLYLFMIDLVILSSSLFQFDVIEFKLYLNYSMSLRKYI